MNYGACEANLGDQQCGMLDDRFPIPSPQGVKFVCGACYEDYKLQHEGKLSIAKNRKMADEAEVNRIANKIIGYIDSFKARIITME